MASNRCDRLIGGSSGISSRVTGRPPMMCSLDDFVDVGLGDAAVPDVLGIDHDGRALLALIETAGLVGADAPVDAALGERLLEGLLQRFRSGRIAAAARRGRARGGCSR